MLVGSWGLVLLGCTRFGPAGGGGGVVCSHRGAAEGGEEEVCVQGSGLAE